MIILACGEAQKMDSPGTFVQAQYARVVGVIDLGANNGDNHYGWCSTKAVVNIEDVLYVLDFLEDIRIETNDGVLVSTNLAYWGPSLNAESIARFDLLVFDKNKEG
jgi:hypothetical protein